VEAAANRQIGEFVLDQPLGGTEAATVYRAYQPALNRYVALKLSRLTAEALGGEASLYMQRFMQEAEVLTSLEHPHIVPIYHYGVVQGEYAYISMRLMHGSLKERLLDGPLPPERVVEIALQLMDALSFAHKKGVIHHDIKPTNILFDEIGSACLTDFGLSKIAHQPLDVPMLEIVLGAAIYTAPEQIRNTSTDHRSDIYSLGVIMYQMLTGQLPYDVQNLSAANLLQKIEHDQPVPPRNFNPEIPVEVERVVMQALRKEPRERFFDAAEMIEALQALPGARPNLNQATPSLLSLPDMMRRAPRRRYAGLILSALIFGTLILLLLLLNAIANEQSGSLIPTVMPEQRASFEEAAPSSAEITRAQQKLGTKGFIAYIACTLDSQFQATRAREMSDFAANYGLAFRAYDSGNDPYQELTTIERARLDGAKAIILCPLHPQLLDESLTSIQQAGIPLVLTSPITDSYGGVVIDTDDYAVGRLAGNYIGTMLAEQADEAKVVILTAPDYAHSEARTQGFTDGLSEAMPGAEILAPYPTGADNDASEEAIAELLSTGQTPDAIFSVTDTGAYGASTALSSAEVPTEDVIIVSVNAESLALDEIFNESYLRATVDVSRESGSRGALNAAIKLLGGGTLPQLLTLPSANLITHDIIMEEPLPE
jgi:serine/threonine protein kinase/DNA-binding LacI/PurR family transcriptional regulator